VSFLELGYLCEWGCSRAQLSISERIYPMDISRDISMDRSMDVFMDISQVLGHISLYQ